MSVNEKMTAIADRIRHYAYETGKLTLDDMANKIEMVNLSGYNSGFTEGYTTGFEEGKQAEYDAFWDNFQIDTINTKKARTHYNYAFYQMGWNDATYNPKYDFGGIQYAVGMFSYSYITDTLKPLDFTKLLATASNVFSRCRQLKTIRKIIVNETTTFSGWFTEDEKLETLIVEGVIGQNGFDVHWSTLLNKASIESIINALSATERGLTVTLSQTAVNNVFTAEEWSALEATRQNWTISLV